MSINLKENSDENNSIKENNTNSNNINNKENNNNNNINENNNNNNNSNNKNKFSKEDKIRLLISFLNENGFEKFENNSTHLLKRLKELLSEGNSDLIIKYFSEAIALIPIKAPLYSIILVKLNESEIFHKILENLTNKINESKNGILILRIIRFFIECVINSLISEENLYKFIDNIIKDNNLELLNYILRCVILIYDKNKKNSILDKIVSKIFENHIFNNESKDKIWKLINNYIILNKEEKINGFYYNYSLDKNEIKLSNNNYNPFENIKNNFNYISFPNDNFLSFFENYNTNEYLFYHETLIIYDIIEGFCDNSLYYEKYLFKINNFNNSDFTFNYKIFPNILINMILNPLNNDNNVTLYSYLIVNLIKNHKDIFCYINNDDIIINNNEIMNNENENENKNINNENIFNIYLNENLEKNFIKNFSGMSIENLVKFLCVFIINTNNYNIINIKSIIRENEKNKFYIKMLCDKLSNLIKDFNKVTNEIYKDNYYKEKIPLLKNEEEKNNEESDYFIICKNLKLKKMISFFIDELKCKNNINEFLYLFISAILVSRGKTLSHLEKTFDLYNNELKDLIKENNEEKEKIILNAIFDVYGHSNVHLNFIFNLLFNNFILSHENVINFIFSEKLLQNKENILNWIFYDLIDNSINNVEYLYLFCNKNKYLSQSELANSDEDKRIDIIRKIEEYENILKNIENFKQIKNKLLIDKFIQLIETGEKFGGNELKTFLIEFIVDLLKKYYVVNNVISEEILINFIEKVNK